MLSFRNVKAHPHARSTRGIDPNLRRDRANDAQTESAARKPFALDERTAIGNVDGQLSASDPSVQLHEGNGLGIVSVCVLYRVGQCFAGGGRDVVEAVAVKADRLEKRAQSVADRSNRARLRRTSKTELR
jgi:hypothetical protein